MFLYVTSPGQAIKSGDKLSELGKKQARMLRDHLMTLEFSGKIFSASNPAATETAEMISSLTGSKIIHFSWLNKAENENLEATKNRILRGYRVIPTEYPREDILIIADSESCEELINIFTTSRKLNTRQYDCALTTIKPLHYFTPILFDTSFMAYEDTTLGDKRREEYDVEFMRDKFDGDLYVPDLSEFTGERILHIGDTESASYPYYRRLFETIRPDVILHTGDIADEVKIGRHPEMLHEYTIKIKEMFETMRATGARIIVVIGNHDVADTVREIAPYAEVYEPGSEVTLSGVPCRLGHQVKEMVFDRKYCMYGHGMAGEAWRDALNIPGEHCRFNIALGNYVYDLANDLHAIIPRPRLIK
jgi:hypothetical protein